MSELVGYNEPFPYRDEIVKENRKPADVLVRWVEQSLLQRVNQTPYRVQAAEVLENVAASDSGTLGGQQAAGVYRVSVYREVTTADPVSSSCDIVLAFTHDGKAMTRSLPAFTGAPQVTTDNAGDTEVVEIDAGTSISYTLTYASNTPGTARFYVSMIAELLQSME